VFLPVEVTADRSPEVVEVSDVVAQVIGVGLDLMGLAIQIMSDTGESMGQSASCSVILMVTCSCH